MLNIESIEQRGTGIDNGSQWSNTMERSIFDRTGPAFSKLFRLNRTDPISFSSNFSKILAEWIVPFNLTVLQSHLKFFEVLVWQFENSKCIGLAKKSASSLAFS